MNIGEKYGKLTTIRKVPYMVYGSTAWECLCDCGNVKVVRETKLRTGHTKSCGCLKKTPANWKDISGKRFGKLTAIKRIGTKVRGNNHSALWICKCDCGNEKEITSADLFSGRVISCGCSKIEKATKHSGSKDRLYKVWLAMKMRCCNQNEKYYKNYGGRGISVCNEWLDYEKFKEWALENGYDENADRYKYSIDRIDTNGNYEPSNCRWTTIDVQSRNKTSTILLNYGGEIMCLADLCDKLGVSRSIAYHRRKAGKPIEQWFGNMTVENVKVVQ